MRQLKITKQVTNRESVSLDKYLLEISREGMITADEEVELARLIRQGDKIEKIVVSFMESEPPYRWMARDLKLSFFRQDKI